MQELILEYYKFRRGLFMKEYILTAFEPTGEKIMDEIFEAEHDELAKIKGEQLLKERELLQKTYRCTSSAGKLILFHS
jgi:hypothetical protein